MKTTLILRTRLSLALVLLIGATIAFGQETPTKVRYRVIDLGADNAIANEISDSGRVVGSKDFGDERHATFWPRLHALPVDLGTLPGGTSSRGAGINIHGQMVGFSSARPVFWANGHSAAMELAGLPDDGSGVASEINSAGQIVGRFDSDTGGQPVFWASSNVSAAYLPLISDQFPNGGGFSINDAGNIFGDACDADFIECHCAFWSDSTSTPVALASPDDEFIYTDVGFSSDFNFAHAMNDRGSMVGFAFNADFSEFRAVYWASSTSPAVILSTTDDFPNGTAEGINNRNQIVGTAYNSDYSSFHAFFWKKPANPGIDLNTVIPPNSGWELVVARSINNRGEIAAAGYLNGDETQHAVVLVPVYGHGGND